MNISPWLSHQVASMVPGLHHCQHCHCHTHQIFLRNWEIFFPQLISASIRYECVTRTWPLVEWLVVLKSKNISTNKMFLLKGATPTNHLIPKSRDGIRGKEQISEYYLIFLVQFPPQHDNTIFLIRSLCCVSCYSVVWWRIVPDLLLSIYHKYLCLSSTVQCPCPCQTMKIYFLIIGNQAGDVPIIVTDPSFHKLFVFLMSVLIKVVH